MENHRLVLPEHLNHYGFLFGGHLLKWVDEFAYIAATIEYPNFTFVKNNDVIPAQAGIHKLSTKYIIHFNLWMGYVLLTNLRRFAPQDDLI